MGTVNMQRCRPGRAVATVAGAGILFAGLAAGMPAAAADMSGRQCSDGAGYELDFSGTGTGGGLSGSQVNQQFVGNWRVHGAGIEVTWQMVDEGGLSGRLDCTPKGNRLNCKDGGTTVTFTCRKR